MLEEYRRRNPESTPKQLSELAAATNRQGDIASSSVFEDERRAQEQQEHEDAAASPDGGDSQVSTVGGVPRDPQNMQRALDPRPAARERWERKKVIQLVRRDWKLTPKEIRARTEREHLVRSHNMKTSVKKLGMVARQIAGKTVDDALVQLRFSKKKVATEVFKQLEFVRDEAVVMRGMGLRGSVRTANDVALLNATSPSITGKTTTPTAPSSSSPSDPSSREEQVQLKDGKRHIVTDPSKIYIDQAWVGRGPYGRLPDYRARGQMNFLRTPWTSISLLLKEEATRVREHRDREAKRAKRRALKVWTPLPDRPIQTHRQWYSW